MFYLLDCLECGGDEIPFESPKERREWRDVHREATGHHLFEKIDTPLGYAERAIRRALTLAPQK